MRNKAMGKTKETHYQTYNCLYRLVLTDIVGCSHNIDDTYPQLFETPLLEFTLVVLY